jgi:hypothetical protein
MAEVMIDKPAGAVNKQLALRAVCPQSLSGKALRFACIISARLFLCGFQGVFGGLVELALEQRFDGGDARFSSIGSYQSLNWQQ